MRVIHRPHFVPFNMFYFVRAGASFLVDFVVYPVNRYSRIVWPSESELHIAINTHGPSLIFPPDGIDNGWFGEKVAINSAGNYAIVGARFDDDNGPSSGSAYIFTRSGTTWTQQAKLIPLDGIVSQIFGVSVDIDSIGSYVIIGAATDDNSNGEEAGAAYIFNREDTTWVQQTKLTASDGQSGDVFGISVTMNNNGDYAVVG